MVTSVDEAKEKKNAEKNYKKMIYTPIPKLIVSLAVPTITSMLITNIYNMADTYFVSKISISASAATGIVFSLMAILQAFGFMFGHGAGSCISRQLGAGDVHDARKYASTSFFLALLMGSLVGIFGIMFINPFMYMLGSTHTILPYAKSYAIFILIAGPAMTTSCVLNNILRYEGKASMAMIGLTAGGIINIILDPIFIFGFDMGILGAGFATGLSQYISAGILLSMFLRGKTQSKINIKYVTRDYKDVVKILMNGSPSFARQGLNSASNMVLNLQCKIYGDVAIAAMSFVAKCINMMFSIAIGIGQGFQPVSGFNYGAGKYSRVRKGAIFTAELGLVVLGALGISCFIFSPQIIGIFRNEAEVINLGSRALRIQCIGLVFLPIVIAGNMMFQSIGKSGRALLLASMQCGIVFVPLVIILSKYFKITGIIIAQPIAWIISVIVTIPIVLKFFKSLPEDRVDEMDKKYA